MRNNFREQGINIIAHHYFRENLNTKILFGDNQSFIKYMDAASSATFRTAAQYDMKRLDAGDFSEVNAQATDVNGGRVNRSQSVTGQGTYVIRGPGDLQNILKDHQSGQYIDMRNSQMSPEVYSAMMRGEPVEVQLEQLAPERVNLFTPLIASAMQIFGGFSGAAYNEELSQAITGKGGDDKGQLGKAADFISRHGNSFALNPFGGGEHIDVVAHFKALSKPDDNKTKDVVQPPPYKPVKGPSTEPPKKEEGKVPDVPMADPSKASRFEATHTDIPDIKVEPVSLEPKTPPVVKIAPIGNPNPLVAKNPRVDDYLYNDGDSTIKKFLNERYSKETNGLGVTGKVNGLSPEPNNKELALSSSTIRGLSANSMHFTDAIKQNKYPIKAAQDFLNIASTVPVTNANGSTVTNKDGKPVMLATKPTKDSTPEELGRSFAHAEEHLGGEPYNLRTSGNEGYAHITALENAVIDRAQAVNGAITFTTIAVSQGQDGVSKIANYKSFMSGLEGKYAEVQKIKDPSQRETARQGLIDQTSTWLKSNGFSDEEAIALRDLSPKDIKSVDWVLGNSGINLHNIADGKVAGIEAPITKLENELNNIAGTIKQAGFNKLPKFNQLVNQINTITGGTGANKNNGTVDSLKDFIKFKETGGGAEKQDEAKLNSMIERFNNGEILTDKDFKELKADGNKVLEDKIKELKTANNTKKTALSDTAHNNSEYNGMIGGREYLEPFAQSIQGKVKPEDMDSLKTNGQLDQNKVLQLVKDLSAKPPVSSNFPNIVSQVKDDKSITDNASDINDKFGKFDLGRTQDQEAVDVISAYRNGKKEDPSIFQEIPGKVEGVASSIKVSEANLAKSPEATKAVQDYVGLALKVIPGEDLQRAGIKPDTDVSKLNAHDLNDLFNKIESITNQKYGTKIDHMIGAEHINDLQEAMYAKVTRLSDGAKAVDALYEGKQLSPEQNKQLQAIVDDYNKAHPDAQIKVDDLKGNKDNTVKLLGFVEDSLKDVKTSLNNTQYIKYGQLTELDSDINRVLGQSGDKQNVGSGVLGLKTAIGNGVNLDQTSDPNSAGNKEKADNYQKTFEDTLKWAEDQIASGVTEINGKPASEYVKEMKANYEKFAGDFNVGKDTVDSINKRLDSLVTKAQDSEKDPKGTDSSAGFQKSINSEIDHLNDLLNKGVTRIKNQDNREENIADYVNELESQYKDFLMQGGGTIDKDSVTQTANKFSNLHTRVQTPGNYQDIRDAFALAAEAGNNADLALSIEDRASGTPTLTPGSSGFDPKSKEYHDLTNQLIKGLPDSGLKTALTNTKDKGGIVGSDGHIDKNGLYQMITAKLTNFSDQAARQFFAIAERIIKENMGKDDPASQIDLTGEYDRAFKASKKMEEVNKTSEAMESTRAKIEGLIKPDNGVDNTKSAASTVGNLKVSNLNDNQGKSKPDAQITLDGGGVKKVSTTTNNEATVVSGDKAPVKTDNKEAPVTTDNKDPKVVSEGDGKDKPTIKPTVQKKDESQSDEVEGQEVTFFDPNNMTDEQMGYAGLGQLGVFGIQSNPTRTA